MNQLIARAPSGLMSLHDFVKRHDNFFALLILIVPNFFAWIILWPGYLQPDHMVRIAEFAAGAPSAQHSLLWMYFAFPFLYLFPSYSAYGLIQVLVFVVCAYWSISIIKSIGFVKTKHVPALLYGLLPTFLIYNELYCSDIVFSYLVMLLTAHLLKLVFVENSAKSSAKNSAKVHIVVLVIMILALLLRKNAVVMPVGIAIGGFSF